MVIYCSNAYLFLTEIQNEIEGGLRMRVLFIGNSHTFFNDMPNTFKRVCFAGAGVEVEAVMLCHAGMTFDWHLAQYFELRYNLLYGKYDYCVLQQAAHPFPEREKTLEAGQRIIEMCMSAGTKPVVMMTWAEKRAPEHQQAMIATLTELASSAGALLAPVGLAWQRIVETKPEVDLFWKDGEHASPLGDYLIACVLYASILGKNPIGLPNIGTDFLKGMEISLDDLHAIEDPARLTDTLDPVACGIIQREVSSICFGSEGAFRADREGQRRRSAKFSRPSPAKSPAY